jgi:hypothetical protein
MAMHQNDGDSMSALSLSSASTAAAGQSGTTATTSAQSQATSALTKISPALAKAHDRLVAQFQVQSTSISQLGQYKAAVSALSGAAQSLAGTSANASLADVTKLAEGFVTAFNAAITQANGTAGSSTSQTEAGKALSGSKRTLGASDASRSQLTTMGLLRQPDGTLKLDAASLKKAFANSPSGTTSALAQLGKVMAKRADSELSDKGRVALATDRASSKALSLKQQESALLSSATQLAQAQSTTSNSWATKQALQRYSAA